jgi:hypothetical protein
MARNQRLALVAIHDGVAMILGIDLEDGSF